MGVNSLPKTVTRQSRDCDLNRGPSAPESSTLTTQLPSHPLVVVVVAYCDEYCDVCIFVHEQFFGTTHSIFTSLSVHVT